MNDFRGKKIVVMGLGLNQGGLGIAKWLLKHGARLTVTDLKDQHALADSLADLERAYILYNRKYGKAKIHRVEYVLGHHRPEDFRRADMIIQNPGVPRDNAFLKIAKKAGVPIESDISLFFRYCSHPIVAISGTKGKTSATAMLGAMLKAAFGRVVVGGNIRRSPLDSLDGLRASKKAIPVALELSSWQLESLAACKRSPRIAVLTNVLPDHLNRYDGMDDYAAAKELIYAWQERDDVAIVPFDNRYTRKMGARVPGERLWAYAAAAPKEGNALFFRGDRAIIRRAGVETVLFRADDLRVPGSHNRWNALLAAGAASVRGAKPSAIRRALHGFAGVPHRLERVKEKAGVSYWNDTAATTPEASIAAMKTLAKGKNIVLIAGGADKELRFAAWAKEVKKHCREVILFDGTATPKMLASLKKAGMSVGDVVRSMTSAVWHAKRAARTGDIVLLSPGCASFGIFVNEFDRGDQFRAAVQRLK
jgi:UDP-N-acetylmuramoylalanine--D-glutamate ligase